MRFERKYRLEGLSPEWIRQFVEGHPLSFRKKYPDRQVNNIYLDSLDFNLYQQNLDGVGPRKKYRIRWYGENIMKLTNPILETKIRINELGSKEYLSLSSTELPGRLSFRNYFRNETKWIQPLEPVFVSSYVRSYYESLDFRFRITIDTKLNFYPYPQVKLITKHFVNDPAVIMEIKYNKEYDLEWNKLSQLFPFRQSKNSKFVTGVQLITSL